MARAMSVLWMVFLGMQPRPAFTQTGQHVKKIRLDLAAASGGKVGQYVDSVTYIPLERTKESGFHSIFQLEMTDSYFVILDKEGDNILIFTRTGAFHGSIKVDRSICQFSLNKKLNQVEVDKYPETFIYNMEGVLIKRIAIGRRPNTLFGVTGMNLDDDHTVYINTSPAATNDSLIYQLLVYKGDTITSWFLPYPKNYKLEPFDHVGPISFGPNLHDADTGIYYMRNYDYTVYRLTPGAITPVYQFVFPMQNSLPKDFASDTSYNGKRMAFLSKDEEGLIVPRLYRFYKKGDQLFFSEGKYSYIFDLKTQQLVSVNKIVSDSSGYFLPLTETEADKRKKSIYLNFDGDHFYFSCSSEVMFGQREAARGRGIRYPPALDKFFSNGKNRSDGNPVLVQVKFKTIFK